MTTRCPDELVNHSSVLLFFILFYFYLFYLFIYLFFFFAGGGNLFVQISIIFDTSPNPLWPWQPWFQVTERRDLYMYTCAQCVGWSLGVAWSSPS